MSILWFGCAWCWPLLCWAVPLLCFLCPLSPFTRRPPLSVSPPSVIPGSRTLGHCSLISPFSFSPLHYRNHQSHHSCACKTPPPLFFFFPCFLAVQFPLIAPSFIPLFVWFWAHFVHSPTLFLSFSLSPPSPNLAFTCVCLLISKCFLPSHLFSPGVANQSRFCLY